MAKKTVSVVIPAKDEEETIGRVLKELNIVINNTKKYNIEAIVVDDKSKDNTSSIAKKYNATTAQVALSWILSHKGVVPVPQTNNLDHLKQNIESNKLILEKSDIIELENYYKTTNYGNFKN